MPTFTADAKNVRLGDFLPGLGDGYVVATSKSDGYMSVRLDYDDYGSPVPRGYVGITYHDAVGDECYLILPGDAALTVKR